MRILLNRPSHKPVLRLPRTKTIKHLHLEVKLAQLSRSTPNITIRIGSYINTNKDLLTSAAFLA